MKITVERVEDKKGLTFTIRVTEPHDAPFTELDKETMAFLDICKDSITDLATPENQLAAEVVNAIHNIKYKTFNRVRESLFFAIQNSIETKIYPICQEVYNWIYDSQKPVIKSWMQEFDPQRTRYYFDNDKKLESEDEDDE